MAKGCTETKQIIMDLIKNNVISATSCSGYHNEIIRQGNCVIHPSGLGGVIYVVLWLRFDEYVHA